MQTMAKNNGGRKSKYPEVQKRIPEIMTWRRQEGLSEKDVAAKLGISVSTLEKYKTEHKEFADALREAKQAIVSDVFSSLLKRAKGYTYEEIKVYTRKEDTLDGVKDVTYTEKTKKHEPPNVAACSLLLKNLDKEHDWSDNPTMLEVKRQELELRKQMAEADNW